MQHLADLRTTVRVTHHYAASSVRVFDAWLTPQLAGLWLFATASRPMMNVSIDARTGGTFYFVERRTGPGIEYRGKYLEITRPRCLAFTLASGDGLPDDTRVSIEIAALRAGCKLRLTHDHLPAAHADRMSARWTGILYGLGRILLDCSRKNYN
jgi:uncharacterized protein YndB with AHSA1/START domain